MVSPPTTAVRTSSEICNELSPRTREPSSQIEARATVGIVRPMLATADPYARLKLVCS
jgi:hypothetical protein